MSSQLLQSAQKMNKNLAKDVIEGRVLGMRKTLAVFNAFYFPNSIPDAQVNVGSKFKSASICPEMSGEMELVA